MKKYNLLRKINFIVYRVFFHTILFVFILGYISCSQRSDKPQNTLKNVEIGGKINIDHFLIFNFDSRIDDIIQLLKSKKIKFNYPIKKNKDGLESMYIKVLDFPIGSGKLDSVDLYFFDGILYLIEHTKSFKEKNCYCEASKYDFFMNQIFKGLYEKYGNPTSAINLHFHYPQDKYPVNSFFPEYDTIVNHITKSSWDDWKYLDPVDHESCTESNLEIGWLSKAGSIILMKKFDVTFQPFNEKIDRSKMPDYLPPLSHEYEDGKIYTFYNEISKSIFVIQAYSQKMNELAKLSKEFSKKKDERNENLIKDSLEKKMRKLINDL